MCYVHNVRGIWKLIDKGLLTLDFGFITIGLIGIIFQIIEKPTDPTIAIAGFLLIMFGAGNLIFCKNEWNPSNANTYKETTVR